jgi:hypothetical protein
MELKEALPILRRLYAPLFKDMDLRISDDHICDREHPPGQCPYPDSAKYTKFDALLDTPEMLERRLLKGGPLKPSGHDEPFFSHVQGAVRAVRGLVRAWSE